MSEIRGWHNIYILTRQYIKKQNEAESHVVVLHLCSRLVFTNDGPVVVVYVCFLQVVCVTPCICVLCAPFVACVCENSCFLLPVHVLCDLYSAVFQLSERIRLSGRTNTAVNVTLTLERLWGLCYKRECLSGDSDHTSVTWTQNILVSVSN